MQKSRLPHTICRVFPTYRMFYMWYGGLRDLAPYIERPIYNIFVVYYVKITIYILFFVDIDTIYMLYIQNAQFRINIYPNPKKRDHE